MKREHLVVVGGGVVGLSIAWEAARRGRQVTVLDRPELPGRSSPAGAGILAAAHPELSRHPLDRFLGTGLELHRQWAVALQQATGLDNGFRPCGGVCLATTAGESAALAAQAADWADEGVESLLLDEAGVSARLGAEFRPRNRIVQGLWVPAEAQVRTPDHLAALRAALRKSGEEIIDLPAADERDTSLQLDEGHGRITSVELPSGSLLCDWFCLAAGAWSGLAARTLGLDLPMVPVRGQMALFRLQRPVFSQVVSAGSRYLVPRDDGHVLAGSTMEEAGFDASTTAGGIGELAEFASSLFPCLNDSTFVRGWAGLRPGTFDGLPYIGWLPGFRNGLIATGHLRAGLQQSTVTARIIVDLIEGLPVDAEWLRLFNPGRRPTPAA